MRGIDTESDKHGSANQHSNKSNQNLSSIYNTNQEESKDVAPIDFGFLMQTDELIDLYSADPVTGRAKDENEIEDMLSPLQPQFSPEGKIGS